MHFQFGEHDEEELDMLDSKKSKLRDLEETQYIDQSFSTVMKPLLETMLNHTSDSAALGSCISSGSWGDGDAACPQTTGSGQVLTSS